MAASRKLSLKFEKYAFATFSKLYFSVILQILRFSFVIRDLRCCFCQAQKYKEQALESPIGGQRIPLTTELLETGLGGLEVKWVYCSLLCQFLDLDYISTLSSLK